MSYYERSRDIAFILDTMDVYVLPVMNPDGYKYTWTTVFIFILILFVPCLLFFSRLPRIVRGA